jgi:hypothetical protein
MFFQPRALFIHPVEKASEIFDDPFKERCGCKQLGERGPFREFAVGFHVEAKRKQSISEA